MISEKEAIKLLEKSEISLFLESYDDIFSDFDPRPYRVRSLSTDFLDEAKRASHDKQEGTIELKLLLIKSHRSPSKEAQIKKRLKDHFRKHYESLLEEKKKTIHFGMSFVLAGIIVMYITSIILFKNHTTLALSFLIVLLEPAGWFLFWEGCHNAIFDWKNIEPDLSFYKKMAKSKIEFVSY